MPTLKNQPKPLTHRLARLQELLEMLVTVPEDWLQQKVSKNGKHNTGLRTSECKSYKELINAWKKALRWRQELDDVLSILLAVCLSTEQQGDQLFFQFLGPPGVGKTRLCDALLVSKHCHSLEHLTGFHSGWKDASGKDYSLISRINLKTLITPEGDVLMSSPSFTQIMSQQRRIFDGTSGASYKNQDEDIKYTGLRTPWIIAGTPALMDTDQSRLGDRFLRICIDLPDADERQAILKRVAFSAIRSVVKKSGDSDHQLDAATTEAYQKTGGYIDYLRANASELLSAIEIDEEPYTDYCTVLGEFTAVLRARPNPDLKKDVVDVEEMPSRLTHQFARLGCCIGVIMNKPKIDEEVCRRLKKVALDTSKGISLDIVRVLFKNPEGFGNSVLSLQTHRTEDKIRSILRFIKKLGVVEQYIPPPTMEIVNGVEKKGKTHASRWRLTEKMKELYLGVEGETDAD